MKKVLTIILFLLCAVTIHAVTYGPSYKGSGRVGYVCASNYVTSGLAQTPVASMGSTSSYANRGMSSSTAMRAPSATGFTTVASNIRGGVTASTTYGRMNGPRKAMGHPGDPGYCEHCIDENNDGICDRCGCDEYDGCDCATDPTGPGYCWCPIGDGWEVWLFMAILAAGYAAWRRRRDGIPT